MTINAFEQFSDRELLDRVARVAGDERAAMAELVALLGEVDARRLYLPEGCSSLFTYCTQLLHFTEPEAYVRIAAARAAREFPIILDRLRDGSLTLTSVSLLRAHLTPVNADELIAGALHKTKREIDKQVATIAPKPDARSMVRRLPEAPHKTTTPTVEYAAKEAVAAAFTAPRETLAPRPICAPTSSERYLLRVTLSDAAHAHLRRAQDLMRHSILNGDPAIVVERALELLVEDLERRRMGRVARPKPARANNVAARYIPAAIRREVWTRNEGRCAFIGAHGRCRETGLLEFHHVEAFAHGGPTTAENLELRCRAHNQYEGRILFGAESAEATHPVGD